MKKLVILFSVIIFTLVLTACGGADEEETTRTFKSEEDGMYSQITLTYKGDKVIKQSTEFTMTYEAIGISSKEEAEEMLGSVEEDEQDIDGLTRESTYTDSEYIEKASVNFEEIDKKELDELYDFFLVLDSDNNVDFEKTIADFEEFGFKEEK